MINRKDSKGRVLRTNEVQRPDGRYEFKYKALNGRIKHIYSWRLTESDPVPPGKRKGRCLRELEIEIEKDSLDGIDTQHKRTLNDCWDAYISNKPELKDSTRNNYNYMYDLHVRNIIGNLPITKITYSVAKNFFTKLIMVHKFKPVSVEIMNTMLYPVFQIAVRDGVIRLNPMDGLMTALKRSHNWDKNTRHPLTREQTRNFLEFVRDHKTYAHWYNMFVVFFGTGGRMGEIVGLTWKDIHWKKNVISINHNLIYRRQPDGKMEFHITTPKTKNGIREIPILETVKTALRNEYEKLEKEGFCASVVDGYSGFIWKSLEGNVMTPSNINTAFRRIVRDYNKLEEKLAVAEHRDPKLLPYFSAHVCRHTFCTRLCEEETDLKLIQEIMGHANITTTMDIYNESNAERKQQSFDKLNEKFKDVL